MPIEYSNPYDAWADEPDHIWVSSDNYLSRFDPATGRCLLFDGSAGNFVAQYRGPRTPVSGAIKLSKAAAENPDVPGEKTVGKPMDGQTAARVMARDRNAD